VLSEEQIDDTLTAAMRLHAEACFPQEACGFIIGKGKKAQFMPCTNAAEQPELHFLISHTDYARAEDEGEILAIWHSHPNDSFEPSEADLAGCEASELPWLISSIRMIDGSLVHEGTRLVKPSGLRVDYIGRPYIFGTFDCYSLVVDYYEREYGIRLDRFPNLRINQWWRRDLDILHESAWRELGFDKVKDGDFQHGDVLCIAMDSEVANHVALYVTGDIILHHLVNRLSRRETFGPYWYSRVKLHLRHRTKC
jgi:proteasome lid subunit RPN8/RPN11